MPRRFQRTRATRVAALSSLARLESLHLKDIRGVDRLLPHLAHAPALRTLTVVCAADEPFSLRVYGPTNPSREALGQLLAAAPQLQVRLLVAASVEEWRTSNTHYKPSAMSAPEWERVGEQWRELQRMGAELERVTLNVVAGV